MHVKDATITLECYNFDHFSRFQIDFELGIQIGKGDNFWKSVFSKLL